MALEIFDDESKYKAATAWLQSVTVGYKRQVEELSKGPEKPDLNKVRVCRERSEICQYILDFMEAAKTSGSNANGKENANAAVTAQNAVESKRTVSMSNSIGKEQLEEIELILGQESAISFCKAALILNLGSKDVLVSKIKGKSK